jgi:beta-lactam-binding protein with PASTA domain/predicted Ser/Thr protein kinase
MGCFEEYDDSRSICPLCGYAEGTRAAEALHMEPGSILADRYIVGRVLGYGGFGVTYIGRDAQLERTVAIKEYLPGEFSTRVPGQTQITVFTDNTKLEQYQTGLRKFVEEARRLAQFQNEDGIVKVFDSFEANNTAYIIMEYLDGETLSEYLRRSGVVPADQAFEMLLPIISSLYNVHQHGIIHRDIAPDNIFITKDGRIKLIDFGAARFATTAHSRSLTVIIKPGYSPEEQYRSRGDQGAYTDVYAVGAVLYRMLTGETPPDALERRAQFESKRRDILKPLSKFKVNLTQNQETAVLNALNVRIEDRTPDMAALAGELTSRTPVARRYGKIKRIDVLRWPLWAKIAAPAGAAAVATLSALFAFGVIGFESFLPTSMRIPDGMARVPSIVNNELVTAEERIMASSLLYTIVDKQYSTVIPADFVLTQDLSAGSVVAVNSLMQITVSGGAETKIVPDVVGENIDAVRQQLEELGFAVRVVPEYSAVVAEGGVIAAGADAGAELAVGETVILRVSMGRDPAAILEKVSTRAPKLTLLSFEQAIAEAELSGFAVIVSAYEYSVEIPAGQIISQNPEAGADGQTGDVIQLVISRGAPRAYMPDIQYKPLDDAVSMLEAEGLEARILYQESETVAKGHVVSQDPSSKTELDPGASVTITVSSGGASVNVPDLTGMKESDAKGAIAGAGFSAATQYEKSDTVPQGAVIRQSPSPGASASRGDTVTITVSSGKALVAVPDVTGRSRGDAQSAITGAKLKYTVVEAHSETVEKDFVISQSPAAGTQQEENSHVVLTVSLGPESITIPDVTGKSQSLAEKTLRDLGFNVSAVTDFSDSVQENNVISQSPKSGGKGYKGDTVTITVSLGQKTGKLPDFTGSSESGARDALGKMGLDITIKSTQEYSDDVPEGCVISQSPWQGAEIKKGDTVSLVVSLGPKPVNMPGVSGKTESEARAALELLGLAVTVKEEYSETVAKGSVISQNPQSGAQVRRRDAATLTISLGRQPIDIPNTAGQPLSAVKPQLEALGFAVTVTEEYSETVPAQSVISQSPSGGTGYKGDTMTLVVSKGKEPVAIPANIVGSTASDARTQLEALGFKVAVSEEYSETVPAQSVISGNPSGGTGYKGDTITLKVSRGREPLTIPADSAGKTGAVVRSQLEALGFAVSVSEEYSESVPAQSVISQSPSGGTGYRGDTIMLKVSRGREPYTLQSYAGQNGESVRSTLANWGLGVTLTQEYSNTVSQGGVISQSPASGATLYRGDAVSLVVSLGPEMITVPNIVNVNMDAAESTLAGQGFAVTKTSQYNSSVARGSVISSSPASGTSVRKDQASVSIVVSNGPDWSTWQDTNPSGDYEKQTQSLYRYRDKTTQTFNSKQSSPWVYDSETYTWTAWKDNGTTSVSSSSTREVQQTNHPAEYTTKTVWRYNRWLVSSTVSAQNSSYGGTYESIELDNKLTNHGRGESHKNSDRYGPYGSVLPDWWWNETSATVQVETRSAYSTYKYRDKVYEYTYYKWGSWSSWSTTELSATNDREVEQKTQYRYRGTPLA